MYRSACSAVGLPGLRAWVMLSPDTDSIKAQWGIDLREYSKPFDSMQSEEDSATYERSLIRKQCPYSLLFFLVKLESLLIADEKIGDAEDFKSKWRLCYADTMASDLSKYPPEVDVCGNCDSILAKIKMLIDCGFHGEDVSVKFEDKFEFSIKRYFRFMCMY